MGKNCEMKDDQFITLGCLVHFSNFFSEISFHNYEKS